MNRWREIYDTILIDRHKRGLNDGQILSQMLDLGYAVSKQDVFNARCRLGLPANAPIGRPTETDRPFKDRLNPLTEAKRWLRNRLVEKADGYYLDGQPAKLEVIMQSYNKIRLAYGMEQLLDNPRGRAE